VDEAHRLSNSTSGRFKIVSDLFKRSKPSGVYMLTGTPITNRPINFFNILKLIDAPVANDWAQYVNSYCDGKQIIRKAERDKYTRIFLKNVGKQSWYGLTSSEKLELSKYLDEHCKKRWVTNGNSNLDELQEVLHRLGRRGGGPGPLAVVEADIVAGLPSLFADLIKMLADLFVGHLADADRYLMLPVLLLRPSAAPFLHTFLLPKTPGYRQFPLPGF
jgi:hypothetical protein